MPPPSPHFRLLRGLAIIVSFNLLGLFLAHHFIPLPGAVLGLMLLAIALFTGIIKIQWVETGADALLKNLMLFFVPALVGVIDLLPILGHHTLNYLLAIVISLITVLAVSGITANHLIHRNAPRSSSKASGNATS